MKARKQRATAPVGRQGQPPQAPIYLTAHDQRQGAGHSSMPQPLLGSWGGTLCALHVRALFMISLLCVS